MKLKFISAAMLLGLLATGCSNDETIEIQKGEGIQFQAIAGKTSRADATTTSSINNFKVWAFTQNTTYMDGYTVTKSDNTWSYGSTYKFWPETAVDFFSVSPSTINVTVENNAVKPIEYTVTDGKEDFLYATNIGETKANHKTSPVSVNFRHALSQIVFQVKEIEKSTITVKVNGIKVDGVASKSTLSWASKTTTPWYANIGDRDTELKDGTWGTWATPTTNAEYIFGENLNVQVADTAALLGEALFLMPQTLDPWLSMVVDTDGNPVLDGNGQPTYQVTGTARVLINCQVIDKESGVQLWPTTSGKTYDWVGVSLTNPNTDPNDENGDHARWMQGKKYIYTLIFGRGAGFTPDDPKPVLVPITFTVTVDEFQNGGSYDLDNK